MDVESEVRGQVAGGETEETGKGRQKQHRSVLYSGTAPSSLTQKVMREAGRAGAGLIYPRFEAIRLASRPTAA